MAEFRYRGREIHQEDILYIRTLIEQYPKESRRRLTMAICAGVFVALLELVCCFLWCSVTAWWIGRKTAAFAPKR